MVVEPHRHNELRCRICDCVLDAATGADCNQHQGPTDGAYSLCSYCGEVSIFVLNPLGIVGLREPTLAELQTFNREHGHLAQALAQIRAHSPSEGP